jgi:hypothetical protein
MKSFTGSYKEKTLRKGYKVWSSKEVRIQENQLIWKSDLVLKCVRSFMPYIRLHGM